MTDERNETSGDEDSARHDPPGESRNSSSDPTPQLQPQRVPKTPQLLVILVVVALLGLLAVKLADDDGEQTAASSSQIEAQIAEAEADANGEPIETAAPVPKAGELAPDFTVNAPKGKRIGLSDYAQKDKPVVVEFIATWCPHCNNVAPAFAKVFASRRDVALLTVGIAGEPARKVYRWHRKVGDVGDVGIDKKGEAKAAYAITGTPTIVFVDGDGKLSSLYSGELTAKQLRGYVDDLAADK